MQVSGVFKIDEIGLGAKVGLIAIFLLLVSCGGNPELEEAQETYRVDVPNINNNSNVKTLWSTSAAGSRNNWEHFIPHVEGDRIYTASDNGRIQGFALSTGKREFDVELKESIVSGVGANVSIVVAATNNGEVVALDLNSGTEKWRHAVGRSISTAPVLANQLVIIRTIDGQLIGLNATTGEQIWALERSVSSLSVGLDAPSLIAGEGVVTGFSNGTLVANNLYSGNVFWEKRVFRPSGKNDIERLIDIDGSPVLVDQTVLVSAYQGGIVRYQLRNGEQLWRNEAISTRKTLGVKGGVIAVTEPQSVVAMLDVDNGETLWRQLQLRGHGLSEPVIMQDSVVVGSLDGLLYFLDIKSGVILSKLKIGSAPISTLRRVEQGIIVYSSKAGSLTLIQG